MTLFSLQSLYHKKQKGRRRREGGNVGGKRMGGTKEGQERKSERGRGGKGGGKIRRDER